MRKETILKREDGSRVKIMVDFVDYCKYEIRVSTCQKHKRTWVPVWDRWERGANETDKERLELEVVTKEEIYNAKLVLWEGIKPVR